MNSKLPDPPFVGPTEAQQAVMREWQRDIRQAEVDANLISTAWVILPDVGDKGLNRNPRGAWPSYGEAQRALALMGHGHQSFRIVEVPWRPTR